MSVKNTRRSRYMISGIIAFLLLALCAVAAYSIAGVNSTSNQSTASPAVQVHSSVIQPIEPTMDLKGVWKYDTGKGGTFEATVADKSIKIVMKTADTSLNYWYGSFEPNAVAGAVIVSKVDENKAVISKSKTKEFTIGQDTLSFDFTMSGNTKKVELRRV